MEGSQRIKVFLNGEEIHVFKGMKVKHILSYDIISDIQNGDKMVVDDEGHERGIEGSLSEGEKVFIKKI
jgi:hypothetical protein